jgi:hypothetical protein
VTARTPALAGAMLLAAAILFPAGASAQPYAALGNLAFEADADDFRALRARAGGLVRYASPWDYAGVAAQTTHYSQSGWSENANGVVGLWRDQNRDTLAGVNVEAGVVRVAGHTRAIGDAVWALRPAETTGIELLAAAGLVETQAAIEQGIGYTFLGGSIEQALTDRFTVIALGAWQPFTDGNRRTHFRARLIWSALPEHGVTAQFRWRQYDNSKEDVGGAYFNPDHYQQWLGVLAFRKRASGWVWSGAAGAGQESVDHGSRQTTYLAELRGEGPIGGNARLAFHASYNRSAGFSNSPDYWYTLAGATLIVPF